MATFAELKQEVRDLIIDLPASVTTYVGALVNRAIRDLQKGHNYRCMRRTFSAQTAVASHLIATAMPTDWKAPRQRPWYQTQAGHDMPMDWIGDEDEEILKVYSPTDPNDKGDPKHLYVRDSSDGKGTLTLEVYPFPDGLSDWTVAPVGEYRLIIPYWGFVPDLTADGDTNWFTVNAEQYIVEQAGAHGFLKDWDEPRAQIHFKAAQELKPDVVKLDVARAGPASRVLRTRADVYGRRAGPVNWRF